MLSWSTTEDNELQNNIVVTRDFTHDPTAAPTGSADYYQFQVLQSRFYSFSLADLPSSSPISLALITPDGTIITPFAGTASHALNITLDANVTYTLRISGWDPAQAAGTVYHLHLALNGAPQDPPPLTVGAAPALRNENRALRLMPTLRVKSGTARANRASE